MASEKRKEVTRLMSLLEDDLKISNLAPEERDKVLTQLKVFGRDSNGADPIYSKSGIDTLSKFGFGSYSPTTSREALGCIANALLLKPKLRQSFVDLGLAEKTAEILQNQDDHVELLACRILFLLTYETKVDFENIFINHSLGNSINIHLNRHARHFLEGEVSHPISGFQSSALSETLKLMFNLVNFYPNQANTFASSIRCIFDILRNIPIPRTPLLPPVNSLINALVNLELGGDGSDNSTINVVFPPSNPNVNIDKLVTILEQAIIAYKVAALETGVIPLLTVLRKIYEIAPIESKSRMKALLLPSDDDRHLPLGRSDSLPSRLLRLSVSPGMSNLQESISSMMFELSDKDAEEFVKNIGYGHAAGFLASHNIPTPKSANTAQSREEASGRGPTPINPVTGQRLDKEPVVDTGSNMTREEKEREAERLFMLFERLKATGVMDVKNPVQQAMEEGKFENRVEEVDDSDSD